MTIRALTSAIAWSWRTRHALPSMAADRRETIRGQVRLLRQKTALTPRERHVMEHATGWHAGPNRLYRNRFTAYADSPSGWTIEALARRGLMERSGTEGDMFTYRVTDAGVELLRYLEQRGPGQLVVTGTPGPWDRDSLAVVACDGRGHGCVLWTAGPHVKQEISEAGSQALDDLGLDDAPLGISVWAGKSFPYPGSWENPGEGGGVEMRGEFRDPTPGEWAAIRRGECPWDEELRVAS